MICNADIARDSCPYATHVCHRPSPDPILRAPPTPPLPSPIQNRHPLNMSRLREKIEPPQTLNRIPHLPTPAFTPTPTSSNQDPHIPSLRVHITTHIHDPPRPKRQQLPQKPVIAALARRIDDDDRLVGRVRDLGEEGRGVGGEEGRVRDAVGAGVVARGGDGSFGDVDAGGGGEEGGEGDGEEAGAGVGVDEVFDWFGVGGGGGGGVGGGVCGCVCGCGVGGGREDVRADVGGEGGEDGVVVLEEGAGRVGELVGVDVFGCGGVGVGDAGFFFGV